MSGPAKRITQWSYSRLKMYTSCPRKAKYAIIDRLPQPSSPAMERGTAIHKLAEDYLGGKRRTVAKELKLFADPLKGLKKLNAVPELELAFDVNWNRTGWFDKNTWVRIKVDAFGLLADGLESLIVDFKTGKRYEDHADQLKLYAVGGFLANRLSLKSTASNWYLDSGESTEAQFARKELKSLQKFWEAKTKPMLNDTKFAPLPSPSCRWCPYSKANGGPCQY